LNQREPLVLISWIITLGKRSQKFRKELQHLLELAPSSKKFAKRMLRKKTYKKENYKEFFPLPS
jgi:hypothetical protein